MICIAHQNIMPVIKSRTMRWAGHVAHKEKFTIITQTQDKDFSLNLELKYVRSSEIHT
jgi:hypothetical protein